MSEYCNNVRNLTISEVVKFIRDTRHLSLERLGSYFQVSKSAVWQWENGNVEPRKSIRERLYNYAAYIQNERATSYMDRIDNKITDEVNNPEHYKLSGLNIEVVDVLSDLLPDFNEPNYLDIGKYLGVVDWSKVAVDTPIIVNELLSVDVRRHFKEYKDNKVHYFSNGRTSWSCITSECIAPKYVRLAGGDDEN